MVSGSIWGRVRNNCSLNSCIVSGGGGDNCCIMSCVVSGGVWGGWGYNV